MKSFDRFNAWIGMAIIFGVVYFGVFRDAANPVMYLNWHALMLVILGTIGVTVLAFPLSKLSELFDFVLLGFFFRKRAMTRYDVAVDLVQGTAALTTDPGKRPRLRHPFAEEAFATLAKSELNEDQLVELLEAKKEAILNKYFDDAKILVAISKFPPALGLLGASAGMIEMMQRVGGAGGVAEIGKAMAVALVATFWGIGLANFVILPLSDFALRQAEEASSLRDMIIETVYMLKKGYSAVHIMDHVSSKLSLHDRSQLKQLIKDTYFELYGVPIESGVYDIAAIASGKKKTRAG